MGFSPGIRQIIEITFIALRRHRILLLTFVALQAADIASTHLALGIGLNEGNPIPAAMLANTGEVGMYVWKLAMVALFLILICRLELRFTHARVWGAVAAINVIMLGVVLSNIAKLV